MSKQRRVRRVVKRTQHPRDISNWRSFDPALRQRPCGLSFEIDDDVILSGIQNLPQMEIAMDTCAVCDDSSGKQGSELVEHFVLLVKHLQRVVEHGAAKLF